MKTFTIETGNYKTEEDGWTHREALVRALALRPVHLVTLGALAIVTATSGKDREPRYLPVDEAALEDARTKLKAIF